MPSGILVLAAWSLKAGQLATVGWERSSGRTQKPRPGFLPSMPGFWLSNPLRVTGCCRALDWNSSGDSRLAAAEGADRLEDSGLPTNDGVTKPGGNLNPADVSPTPVTGVDGFGVNPRPKLIGSRPSAPLPEPPGLELKKSDLLKSFTPFLFCC